VEVVIEEKVPVVTTGAGNPGKDLPHFKAQGIKVLPVVSAVALAKRLVRAGADAVIAEGMECGGHIGEDNYHGPATSSSVSGERTGDCRRGHCRRPGVGSGIGSGAQGVQMGTRFVASVECTVHENYKQAVVKAKDRSTVITGASIGHPVR